MPPDSLKAVVTIFKRQSIYFPFIRFTDMVIHPDPWDDR